MSASEVRTITPSVLSVVNTDKTGKNLVVEIHEVTFDTDKTVEVDVQMKTPKAMYFCEKSAAVGATKYHLGTDLLKDATTGKLTVSTVDDNALSFICTFIGYN